MNKLLTKCNLRLKIRSQMQNKAGNIFKNHAYTFRLQLNKIELTHWIIHSPDSIEPR